MGWYACRRGFSLGDSGKHLGNRFARPTGPPVQRVTEGFCAGGYCRASAEPLAWCGMWTAGTHFMVGRCLARASLPCHGGPSSASAVARRTPCEPPASNHTRGYVSHTPPDQLCVVRAREVAAVPTTIGAASGGPGWPGDFPIFRSVSCTARRPSGNCDGGCL